MWCGKGIELVKTYWTNSISKMKYRVRSINVEREIKIMAYRELVESQAANLYRYGFWLCNDQHKATCLVQKTFLQAWECINKGGQDSFTKIQLFKTLHKFCDLALVQSAPESDVFQQSKEHETSKLHPVLELISIEERELLILQLVDNFNCEEISSIVGIPQEIVQARVDNTKRQLMRA